MNINNSIEKFYSSKYYEYKFLKSIELKRNISNKYYSKYNIEIVLSKLSSNDYQDIQLRFINAFGIKLGHIEGMPGLLVDIRDISDRQIEGGRYEVTEQEELTFSFYCEEFFADLIPSA